MVLDALVQLAFQHPEIAVTLGYVSAIALSWKRIPAKVPIIPGLYITGLMVLLASGFYFFAVPEPTTGLERLFRQISDAIFIGLTVLGLRELVKIKTG